MRLLLKELLQWACGSTPKYLASSDVFAVQYSSLSAQNRMGIEASMLANSNLTRKDRMRSYSRTSRNSRLRCNHGVFANFDVVRNLHQIIDFRAAANHR